MKNNTLASRIARIAFAAAIVTGTAVALPAPGGNDDTAGLTREQALRLSQPMKDHDDAAWNMPVLSGNTYRR